MSKIYHFVKLLGPGLLFASMAIGTSHLVLSTKAGAQYGWVMLLPIILANLLKYPFFEFGIRYTHVTEKTLIQGYSNLGKGYLWTYAGVTIVSTFTILAALYVVTAGLLLNLFQIEGISVGLAAAFLFLFIGTLLIIGRYKFLEDSLKLVISVLFLALLITTVMVLYKGSAIPLENFKRPAIFNEVGILFLISLVGWMPTAVEASGWVSMWSIEKIKSSEKKPTLNQALAEFNVGYVLTAVLAIFFMTIGCMTLYGTGTELSSNSVTFADQVVNLFTAHIGDWAYLIIAIGAFATMFSTCMTAHDAVSRVSLDVLGKLFPKKNVLFSTKAAFAFMVVLMALINWVVITVFGANMGNLVALATFVSFVMAPIIGWMNLKTVVGKDIEIDFRPGKKLQFLTYLGIIFLTLFAIYYCWLVFS